MRSPNPFRETHEAKPLGESHSSAQISGRWGETDKEKGPVDLFPVEPTDEASYAEEKATCAAL